MYLLSIKPFGFWEHLSYHPTDDNPQGGTTMIELRFLYTPKSETVYQTKNNHKTGLETQCMRLWNSLVEPDPLQHHGTLGITGTNNRSISMRSIAPLMTSNGWNDGVHK